MTLSPAPPLVPELGRPYRKGDRVRVIAREAPSCRSGTVEQVDVGRGGCLVRHDEPEHFPVELFGNVSLFGWSWSELEPEGH